MGKAKGGGREEQETRQEKVGEIAGMIVCARVRSYVLTHVHMCSHVEVVGIWCGRVNLTQEISIV